MADVMALKADIEKAIQGINYTVGVAIKYLESNTELHLNCDRTYQLASVFKVPVLVTAVQQLDSGKLRLDQRVVLKDSMKTSPSGVICYLGEGLQPTLKDLLLLMIIISDNTATDMVIDLVGGTPVVNQTMRHLGFGIDELNITMNVHKLFEDTLGTSECILLPSEYKARAAKGALNLNSDVFREGSTSNVANPIAMNRLHEMIYRGQAASRKACDVALDVLLHQTLNLRLPAQLPFGTDVAHKTGTFFGCRNDSGTIYVNDQKHVIVTVLTQRNGKITRELTVDPVLNEEAAVVDKAIARIGRIAFDHADKLG